MTEIDTSAEAVERLAARLERDADDARHLPPEMRAPSEDDLAEIAATLRALLRERDELAADCLIRVAQENDARHRAETERDAARAEVARLREALACAADELAACETLARDDDARAMVREWAAKARAALAGEETTDD